MNKLYHTIEGKDHLNSPITVYVKGDFAEGWNNDDVIARAEDRGIDFGMFKTFYNPKLVTESEFNRATDSQADHISEYVAWEDENGYYEPKSKGKRGKK